MQKQVIYVVLAPTITYIHALTTYEHTDMERIYNYCMWTSYTHDMTSTMLLPQIANFKLPINEKKTATTNECSLYVLSLYAWN